MNLHSVLSSIALNHFQFPLYGIMIMNVIASSIAAISTSFQFPLYGIMIMNETLVDFQLRSEAFQFPLYGIMIMNMKAKAPFNGAIIFQFPLYGIMIMNSFPVSHPILATMLSIPVIWDYDHEPPRLITPGWASLPFNSRYMGL